MTERQPFEVRGVTNWLIAAGRTAVAGRPE